MPHPRRKARAAIPVLATTAAIGAAGFGATAAMVGKRRISWMDGVARQYFPKRRRRSTKLVTTALGYTGKPYVHGPAAALLASYLSHKGARDAGQALNLASTLAAATSKTLDWTIHKRIPPPGRHSKTEPSFPSGHTLETAAVALTGAYVLWREGLADARIAFPLAVAAPLAAGLGRLYLDRHWITDVMGGLMAGISIAAVCAGGYELRARQ